MTTLKSHNTFPLPGVETAAKSQKKSNSLAKQFVAACSLVLFTLLATFNPIIVRVANKEAMEHGGYKFVGSITVFATEVCKVLLCCIVIPIKHRSLNVFVVQMTESFTVNIIETIKICVPALMYVVRNYLYFFALQRIDTMLFSLTFQLRIPATVILMMIVLGRRFTRLQWVSLLISLTGVVIFQLGEHLTHPAKASTHELNSNVMDKLLGIAAVLVMCLATAFGSVYMEAVMKTSTADIFLQNIRLSLISLPFSIIAMIYDRKVIMERGFFCGWNFYVWLVVVLSAVGGIVVSAVLLHTDNVRKGLCQALALGGTTLVAILLGDVTFSFYLLTGIVLVITSVVLYALAPRRKKDDSEFQPLVESASDELAILEKEKNPTV